jgi:DNA-binding MarR family transcriptional regulator
MTSHLLDRLLAISSLLQHDMRRAFAGTVLSETRVHALWVLHHVGPSPQQTLAEALQITPRSVSAIGDTLEAHGYVQRGAHPTDRRAVLVTLTPTAQRLMTRMQEDHAHLTDDLVQSVAEPDRAAFQRGVDAVLTRLSQLVSEEAVHYPEVEGEGKVATEVANEGEAEGEAGATGRSTRPAP